MTDASSSASSSRSHYPLYHSDSRDSESRPFPSDPSSSRHISLREPPSPDIIPASRPTLSQFRTSEGASTRQAKLRSLWESLPTLPALTSDGPTALQRMKLPDQDTITALSPERADRLRQLYQEELVRRVREKRPQARLWGGADDIEPEVREKGIAWADFRRFLWDQERDLWEIFQDLDRNGDGRLDVNDMRAALAKSGIEITPATAQDLVSFLASGSSSEASEDMYITFQEFRDFLIMLPRKATPFEIYKFYQVRKRFSDGRGAARVDKEGDLNVSFPKSQGDTPAPSSDEFADDSDGAPQEDRHEAWRFLLAGGEAGAVSRSVTAPFDRLKVYLITTENAMPFQQHTKSPLLHPFTSTFRAMTNLWGAVTRIYVDGGGLKAFWVGNGLNVTKIFPESAIKFVSYEQTKKLLAKYWDQVGDVSEISSSSRFFAGGVGGITSQFSIYGLETLKTRIQSELGPAQGWRAVVSTARQMWAAGGIRAFYRGLTLGLVGVFPYSAIDMGTYETLKKAYCRSTGKDEPEVIAVLSFGALSGSIGAASVYPINLLRTRLQASGSSGHRHQYTGFVDVLQSTLKREGPRGLYKGLLPSILKVGPAVGVSWIVYEDAKRRLGVAGG
ncbi:mitochondrial carrier domain-containing protein [Kockovaella imperatae]|uniref:Mitochondrial carrier domain-containing protein n=1 Tax=Kockovaella imperatae TaxID=4999 RepID=A0A1Y1UFH9_9TREE|nr:mitochondrial carrier domain-containing protein [Kockovaella imperatae]ORX36264.1 mitochondrial carrier domain-containing protein [Kockovaella imperatae]